MKDWTPEDLKLSIESGGKVFLKLWKKGCGACKLSEPALERIEASDTNGTQFGQVSTDEHPEILEIAESEVLPAFFLFENKVLLRSQEGFKGLERLKSFVSGS